jgi:hypothetical protein
VEELMDVSLGEPVVKSFLDMLRSPTEQRIAELEQGFRSARLSFAHTYLREWLQSAYHHPHICRCWYSLWNRRGGLQRRIEHGIGVLLKENDGLSLEELEYLLRLMHEQRVIPIAENFMEGLAEQLVRHCKREDPGEGRNISIEHACDAVLEYHAGTAIAAKAITIVTRLYDEQWRWGCCMECDDL